MLRLADGVIVTCLADPLSLRTIPTAAAAINLARSHHPNLQLLGLLIAIYHEQDSLQVQLLQHLRRAHGRLILEPPIPHQQEVCDWVLEPGRPLSEGPARESYQALADLLDPVLFPLAAQPGTS